MRNPWAHRQQQETFQLYKVIHCQLHIVISNKMQLIIKQILMQPKIFRFVTWMAVVFLFYISKTISSFSSAQMFVFTIKIKSKIVIKSKVSCCFHHERSDVSRKAQNSGKFCHKTKKRKASEYLNYLSRN